MMPRKRRIRICKTAAVLACALSLLAGSAACADDIMDDDGFDSDFDDDFGDSFDYGSYDDSGDSAFLIEDTGEDVQYNAGVPMDTLQAAIDSGNKEALDKIASLGALTGKNSNSSRPGTGIGGSGAYRGDDDMDDEDDEEYYDLNLDEGDADEVTVEETEEVSESPGHLIAASTDRVQEHLDEMGSVESPTGSDGELTVASYIESRMGSLGYTIQEQSFHEGVLNEDGTDAPGVNILAERGANSKKNRKKDIFLIVTHYDSKRSPSEDDPFANDKSGAAALMESARILSEVVTDTDICFLFLSGEEDGGYGAQNFISTLSEENRSRITGVLSVERVGYDSDTPYVLKTLTGESNALGDRIRQLGLTNDEQIAQRPEEDSDDEGGTWVEEGQSSDGYIDERTAAQIQAAQAGELSDDHSIEIDTADYLDEEGDLSEEDDSAKDTEAAPVPMPGAWSYLKASSPILSSFAGASLETVTLSQYMPALDALSFEETKALGLADEADDDVESGSKADGGAVPEDSALTGSADEEAGEDADFEDSGFFPVVSARRVADTANVISAAVAQIMDPAT